MITRKLFTRVVVTKHCKVRAEQRLRLFLSKEELRNIERFIRKEFDISYLDHKLNNVPFYKTKVGCEVFVTNFVKFYCKVDKGTVYIMSCIKNRGQWRY
jgi:hypothetical protein